MGVYNKCENIVVNIRGSRKLSVRSEVTMRVKYLRTYYRQRVELELSYSRGQRGDYKKVS